MKSYLGKLAICLVVCAAAGFSFFGCGDDEKPLIGVVVHSFDDKFVSYLCDGFTKAVNETNKYRILISDSKKDVNKEGEHINNLIAMGAKGIILHCVDANACENYIKLCREKKVPLVTTKPIYSQTPPDVNVGCSSYNAGVAEAEGVVKSMGTTGNVVILFGELGSEYTNERTRGNKEVFAKYPGIKVVNEDTANWRRDQAMRIVENLSQSGVDFQAVVCNNDEMAIGAALALQGQGKDMKDYTIAGIDATPDALQAIRDDLLDVTVFENPLTITKSAVDAVIALIDKKPVDKNVVVPSVMVDKSNVAETEKAWEALLKKK